MSKLVIVSGLKPTGELHIGNYLGMLKQAAELQNSGKYDCFYFIADYHSLTVKYKPEEKKREILNMAVDILAAGIDSEKSTFFLQSAVPEHANLAWIFNTITSVGELERMVEYKEKISGGETPNVGLFDYPVLMAADILLYKGEFVPAGEDQLQHLELTRTIVRTFNKRFGKIFKEPRGILAKIPRVMSLDDPTKKMSKTLPKGCLYLSDSPQIIRRKIQSAVTDSYKNIVYDFEKRPAISNLILIYSEFSGIPIPDAVEKFKSANYADFKKDLAEVVIKALKPIQEKREKIAADEDKVLKILSKGAKKAEVVARQTMDQVKEKVGLL
ncbi:MAG: tryptophan--tRNA ligase [Candidatus Niyogibacteria bacterium RIFCSPLOWO2_12_FULL_41_13]|uniref:Tryptophan--tRNA ligase n=1 Tax=Candidatus Niyogibacteria bacterium RIFCSPLOWO2_12_FULL_41_13 TaxID=1801726 RepID=A0A1G2F3H8_9BACT|nr:MAG: tryptophan--tRNA ligase [Candidatus Niyogibacteria bacterium RIFCSPLOWO2_12_FULL_41_13]